VAQLVAPLVSIHVVGLPDPYYESASFVGFSAPEVSLDEGFQREAETSINNMLFLVVLE